MCAIGKWNRHTTLLLPLMLATADYLTVVGAVYLAYVIRKSGFLVAAHPAFAIKDIYIFFAVPTFFLLVLFLCNTYRIDLPYWDKVRNIFKSVVYGGATIIFLMYFTYVAGGVSRLFIGMSLIFILLGILIVRYLVERLLIKLGVFQIPVIIVGAGKTAELLLQSFERNPIMRYHIVGFIDDKPVCPHLTQRYPLLGTFADIDAIIKESRVQHVIICAPGLAPDKLVSLVTKLELLVRNVSFVPELIGIPVANISVQGLMEESMVLVKVQNNLARRYYRVMKRIFDLVVTLVGLVFILPIGLIIAAIIYITDPGPVLFAHKRVGQHGKEFPCYKFRSMIVNSQEYLGKYLAEHPEVREEWERDFKLKDDPRITKIGHFLRKTSLDELPQLINVLKGEMSLVGPRPIVQAEVEKYGEYIQDFYLVPPGITGVWQVSGRSDTTYEERVQMDSWYVHNWSVWIDIVYLIRTVTVVLQRKGAY